MGKHKHRHNGGGQPSEAEDALAASLGGGEAEAAGEDTPDTPEGEGEATPDQPNQEPVSTTVPTAEQPKSPEVKPVNLDAQTPAKPAVRIVTVRRPVAVSKAKNETVKKINAEVSEDPRMHTAAGRQLIKMFDEYDALMKQAEASPNNERLNLLCANKLNDIMATCCPHRGNPNAGVYNELIRIVFKRLSQGYGTKYKDSTLFRLDYRLPTPVDSMKFDTFWNVMYQLVESAKTGSRITFNTTTVAKILNSPAAMVTITAIRRRLEQNN